MSDLAAKECVPCKGGVPPLAPDRVAQLLEEVSGWSTERNHHLTRTFAFPDFATALDFVNRIGAVAEQQAHHPDIYLTWGKVRVDIWTHKIDGLTESDFILAAKIDKLAG
jgi:4a-hydroxytetrahydrobiopterin dehydratase